MRSMREQGMTNKQIANSLGVAVSTVYRYIGKRSVDVHNAEIQNKPNPIKPKEEEKKEEFKFVPSPASEREVFVNTETLMVESRPLVTKIEEAKPTVEQKIVIEVEPQDIAKTEPVVEEERPMEETVEVPVEEKKEEPMPKSESLLQVINTRIVFRGSLCNYIVDTETGSIEMTDGIITGLLDKDTVKRFIAELTEASKILKED